MYAEAPRTVNIEMAAQTAGIFCSGTKIELLIALAEGPTDVSGLCAALQLSQSLISHHLAALREIGAVKAVRHKRSRLYSLTEGAIVVRTASSILIELRTDWTSMKVEVSLAPLGVAVGQKTTARSPSP